MLKFSKTNWPVRNSTNPVSECFYVYLSSMIRILFLTCILYAGALRAQLPENNYLPGRTTGILPYLEYGLGADRLGGAKMTFLDTGILVKVIDSTIVNYRVQLSKDHFAYLPKNRFRKDTTSRIQPYYLTGSWMVNGNDSFDFVSVALDERLPYRSMQELSPSRIVIDIFGATSNTNWVTQRSGAKEIKQVRHEQIEDDVFRVIIELKHEQHWGYRILYEGNRLVIRVQRQPEKLHIENMKIAVDAGHGGDNTGASGSSNRTLEKNYTLLIAKELEKELVSEGANVFMTRTNDASIGMNERIAMLENAKPHFLISIHLNSSVKDSVKGVSTYYRYPGFRPLTQFILNSMLELGLAEFGNVGSFNFALSGPTDYPNCLVEVAFLSNKEDEKRILDPQFHKDVAKKITEGIKEWLKYCRRE